MKSHSLFSYFNVVVLSISALFISLFVPQSVFAADLVLSPASGVYTSGQTFTVNVRVNTKGKTISAVEGALSFSPNDLSVVSVTKGSMVDLWVADPAFSNSKGTITFTGGMFPPGYSGSAGTIMSVTFRSKGSGASRVSFTNGSVNEFSASGSNILTSMNGGTYTIAAQESSPTPEVIEYVPPANTPSAPVITSTTHTDAAGWYTAKTAELSWSLPSGVTALRTLLDSSPSSVPTRLYESPIRSISLTNLDEGVQYFHLQFQNADGWGRVAHYRLAIDTSDPTLKVVLPDDRDPANPAQRLLLEATDEHAGLARAEVQLDGGEVLPFELENSATQTIQLPELAPGKHTAIVEVFDAAGNSAIDSLSFTIESFSAPQFENMPTVVNSGVIPVFQGITRSNADVVVVVTRQGTDAVQYTLRSDSDGVFTFIPEGRLQDGVYDIYAYATDEYGARSDDSNTYRFVVAQPGLLKIGSLAVGVLSVIVPLAAMSILLVLGLLFVWRRFRRFTTSVEKEASEVVTVVTNEFSTLEKELVDAAKTLAATRKSKSLTKAEEALVATVTRSVKQSKEHIEKELKDVTNIVSQE